MTSLSSPSYLRAFDNGILDKRILAARQRLKNCGLCPRACGKDRTAGERGYCKTGASAVVCSYNAHFGEEAPLVGRKGSGTIFFSHCNLLCNFCQNFEISHGGEGRAVSAGRLAGMMMALQEQGCHNINFVTPTHVVPQILTALKSAVEAGLSIPLVYNSSGYDSVETLRLLDGIVDIYMPDFKFWDAAVAEDTCRAADYPDVARAAVLEMHRQVGALQINADGIATRGLLVRHLVLPDGLAGTRQVMRFLAQEVSADTYVNIMPQYRPCGRAAEAKGMERPIRPEEFDTALGDAEAEGIWRLDQRRRVFIIR